MSADLGQLTAPDGSSLRLRTWVPEGKTRAIVLLVHGLGEHCGRYEELARVFTATSIAVVAYDQRGHGESPGPRGHAKWPQLLDDLDAAVAHVRAAWPDRPLFLYGHSLGGVLVTRYVQTRDYAEAVAGVIASAPAFRPAFDPPAWKLAAARLLARLRPSQTLHNELDLTALCRDPKVVAAYRADPLTHDRISARLGLDLLEQGATALSDSDSLQVPMLLLHGDADRLTSFAASAEFAEQAGPIVDFVRLPGAFHEPHHDPGHDRVLARVADWVRRSAAGRPAHS